MNKILQRASLSILVCISSNLMAQAVLTPYQYLKTNGARDVTPFTIDNQTYLAVPQLAKNVKAHFSHQ